MEEQMREQLSRSIRDFRLPKYSEIPDVGLFLEQTTKYVSQCLAPLEGVTITNSMISNYVKMKLIESPVKRQYSREQIAYLIFIAVAKTVLSLEHIQLFIRLQRRTYDVQRAYEYCCSEFENILFYVFGLKDELDNIGGRETGEKQMLRNTIITAAYKIYLEKYFRTLQAEERAKENG